MGDDLGRSIVRLRLLRQKTRFINIIEITIKSARYVKVIFRTKLIGLLILHPTDSEIDDMIQLNIIQCCPRGCRKETDPTHHYLFEPFGLYIYHVQWTVYHNLVGALNVTKTSPWFGQIEKYETTEKKRAK